MAQYNMSWIAVYLKLYLSSFETCKAQIIDDEM